MRQIIAMLDRIADSLEAKGLLKEAEELDMIANSIEAGNIDKEAYGAFKEIENVDSKGVEFILAAAKDHHWISSPNEYTPSEQSYTISPRGRTTVDIAIKGKNGKFEVSYNSGNPDARSILDAASQYNKTIVPGQIKEAEELQAGTVSKILGGAAIALLSMVGSLQAGGASSNRVQNDVQSMLIDLQEAKSKELVDVGYRDLVQYLSKLNAGPQKEKLIQQAEEVRKDTLKKISKG